MESSSENEQEQGQVVTPPDRHEIRREIADFVKLVAWFLVVFLALKTYVVEGYEVQGPSMIPTLEDNERILVFKLPHVLSRFSLFSGVDAFEPGDIVVFDSPDNPDKRYVKRIIAMGPRSEAGKTVSATAEDKFADPVRSVEVEFSRGKVYVDKHLVKEEYLPSDARRSNDSQSIYLGPGEYYVLGDNRSVSKDSRSFNAIDEDMIIGKAVFRFWPLNRISLLQ